MCIYEMGLHVNARGSPMAATFFVLRYFTIETEPRDLHDSVTVASETDYDCQLVDFPKGTRI